MALYKGIIYIYYLQELSLEEECNDRNQKFLQVSQFHETLEYIFLLLMDNSIYK